MPRRAVPHVGSAVSATEQLQEALTQHEGGRGGNVPFADREGSRVTASLCGAAPGSRSCFLRGWDDAGADGA